MVVNEHCGSSVCAYFARSMIILLPHKRQMIRIVVSGSACGIKSRNVGSCCRCGRCCTNGIRASERHREDEVTTTAASSCAGDFMGAGSWPNQFPHTSVYTWRACNYLFCKLTKRDTVVGNVSDITSTISRLCVDKQPITRHVVESAK